MSRSAMMLEVRLLDHPVSYGPLAPFPQPAGAECIFIGRTRAEEHPAHGQLIRLEYEAYRGMAERVLRELAQAAVEQFGCLAVRVHHAVGPVPIGEASVLVQVAGHRRDGALHACRFLIDEVKARAPIWKREVWSDGATWSAGQPVIVSGFGFQWCGRSARTNDRTGGTPVPPSNKDTTQPVAGAEASA